MNKLIFATLLLSLLSLQAHAGNIYRMSCQSTTSENHVGLVLDTAMSILSYDLSLKGATDTTGYVYYSTTFHPEEYRFAIDNLGLRGGIQRTSETSALMALEGQQGYQEDFICSSTTVQVVTGHRCPHGVCASPTAPRPPPPPPCGHHTDRRC